MFCIIIQFKIDNGNVAEFFMLNHVGFLLKIETLTNLINRVAIKSVVAKKIYLIKLILPKNLEGEGLSFRKII